MKLPGLFKRRTFNDTLALILLVGIPGLWVANKWLPIPAEVTGATIAGWTLVVQHYFRKAAPDNGPSAPKPSTTVTTGTAAGPAGP